MNDSSRPSPSEIADVLRERIRDLRAGDSMPTQADLAEEFGVERGTVRQAMRVLQKDGLLTEMSKGSPPKVAEGRTEAPQSRTARVALTAYLAETFRSSEVRIDAICFTAETLMLALMDMCVAVANGEVHPRSIEVRCLLPGPDVILPYPEPVDRPDLTEQVHSTLKEQIKQQMTAMEQLLYRLKRDYGIESDVTFRPLPFVPSVKQYVLNGTLVLEGKYQVGRRSYKLPDVDPFEVLDVSGFNSTLFEFRQGDRGQSAKFVQDTKNCFEAFWESNAPRQTLTQ